MKRGAFSLSVNAIVILILAIVMLGLGVTFIRNMFGNVSGQIEEMISAEPDPQEPFRSAPITLSREHIITTSGGTEVIKVSVYNAWGAGDPGDPIDPIPTTTDYDCTVIPENPAVPFDGGGTDVLISGTTYDDNVCVDIDSTIGADICSYTAGAIPFCYEVSAAAGLTCTDIAIAGIVPGVGDVAGRYDDYNWVKCEFLGCGPSDGTACTNLAPPPQQTTQAGDNATPEVWCADDLIRDNINASLQTYTKEIATGDTGTFNLIFDIGKVSSQTYLCQVRLKEQLSYSKDFVIDVRRN